MDENLWDVVIAGGGAAGLSAALMLGRARRRVLVVDRGLPRNRFAAHMHGVLGRDGTDPADLLAAGRAEVAAYGVRLRTGAVERVELTDDGVIAIDDGGAELRARALIVATGLRDELPDIPGLAARWGRSVLHCPYCHGWEVRGRRLGVLAASEFAVHQVQLVRQWSDDVVFFSAAAGPLPSETEARLRARGVEIVTEPVVAVLGEGDLVSGVRLSSGAVIPVDALFTAGAPRPYDGLVAHLGLDRVDGPFGSFLAVDATGRTSDDRIWAVGNVVTPSATVAMAIGAGATVGGALNMALVAADFDAAVARSAAADFWEARYAGVDRAWSGQPNQAVVDVVSELPPGRALDLGCGEGGDAIWLARQGWRVTGVDISATAIDRARVAASADAVDNGVEWVVHDLATWRGSDQPYDLVTASFLQSPVQLARAEILQRAARLVASGGHLLIVSHGAPPPWAAHGHDHHFPTPQEEIDMLEIGDEWQVRLAETRSREWAGPDGRSGQLDDTVVLLYRKP